MTRLDAIPLTTPARTLCDLASTTTERELERALAEALARGLTSVQVETLLARNGRRPGRMRLSALLSTKTPLALTRSEAEEAFLALIRRAQLPGPEVNVMFLGYEVDFVWRAEQFVAEIDGFAFHASRRRFESDRRRDGVLAAAGVRVMRVTWRQIVNEPEALLVGVAQALTRAV